MLVLMCPGCRRALQAPESMAGRRVLCPACKEAIPVPGPPVAPPVPTPAARPATLVFPCPGCQQQLQVPAAAAGKPVRCPRCSGVAIAPARAPAGPKPVPVAPPVPPAVPGSGAKQDTHDPIGETCPQKVAPAAHPITAVLSPPQAPDELGRLGQYRVLKVLGQGGMGAVFGAQDQVLRRPVALKVMLPHVAEKPENRERFLREARATAAIKHDHIVTIYQVGEEGGVPYLAMELLQGEPLDVRLKREGRLPVPDVLRIGREIAEGLAAAHERNLTHRDIKPANIWLEAGTRKAPGGRVKILDFGLAQNSTESVLITQAGAVLGTPAYMSPEQARSGEVDSRSDLFSLGCVLYHIATGERPFKGNDIFAVAIALATETPATPAEVRPELPAELSDLVMRLLEKAPNDRPASAAEVGEQLEALGAPTFNSSEAISVPEALPLAPSAVERFSDMLGSAVRDLSEKVRRKEQPVWRRALHLWPLAAAGVTLLVLTLTVRAWLASPATIPGPGSTSLASTEPGRPRAPLGRHFANSIGMEFVLVPKGKFLMGSPHDEKDRADNEEAHEVEVAKPFYLGVYEVTQGQFSKVANGYNPSAFAADGKAADRVKGVDTSRLPVESVTLAEAKDFCKTLSEMPEEKRNGRSYRLPSEVEWEFACRAGGKSGDTFSTGKQLSSRQANFNGHFPHGDSARGPYPVRPVAVGSYAPNGFGLYDMHGNVAEWCADWHDGGFCIMKPGKPADTHEPPALAVAQRGGSWVSAGRGCRSAARSMALPDERSPFAGFRVVLVVGP